MGEVKILVKIEDKEIAEKIIRGEEDEFWLLNVLHHPHTPHGHILRETAAMHFSSSTTYSYEPSLCSTLLIAPQ